MSVIYILLTISLVVALGFLCAFFYAVRQGQFDDSYTPSVRILFDDEIVDEKPRPEDSPINTEYPLPKNTASESVLKIKSKDVTNIQLSLTRQTES